jgi:hypothetical protein
MQPVFQNRRALILWQAGCLCHGFIGLYFNLGIYLGDQSGVGLASRCLHCRQFLEAALHLCDMPIERFANQVGYNALYLFAAPLDGIEQIARQALHRAIEGDGNHEDNRRRYAKQRHAGPVETARRSYSGSSFELTDRKREGCRLSA